MKCIPLFLLVMSSLVGCSKNNTETDHVLPIVAITSPANDQVFPAGETVSITGNLSDNQKLTEVHVHISNNTTGALLIDIHRSPGTPTYQLNESFQTEAGINY